MTDTERDGLRAAVEGLHNCTATFSGAEVCNAGVDEPEFAREVATFALSGHPTAPLAYAWSDVREQRTQYRVVLHSGGVTSASDALRGFFLFHRDTPP